MERLLAGRADDVGGPEAFGRLETLLTAWSDSDRGTPRIRARAAACLRDLYCRAGSLRPEDVGSTLAAARRLALEAGDEAAPRAFAHLLGRLARVDAEGAAEQLVEASRAIHEWPGDQRSWKLRWARAARPALVGVIAALTTTRWRQMLRGLVPHDPGLLAQAVEVAAEQRDEPQSFIEAELAQEHCAHARALLTLAWQRRLRRDGSRLRWPEILERWHARGSAAERGRAPS